MSNGTAGRLLALDNLALRGRTGRNYLLNGDFSAGGDCWLSSNDFDHLPWHAKNLLTGLKLLREGIEAARRRLRDQASATASRAR